MGNATSESLKARKVSIFQQLSFYEKLKFHAQLSLTFRLQESSADNLCKQLGPREGPNFLTLMVFKKEFFKKGDFEKISRRYKMHENYQSCKELNRYTVR